MRIIPLIASALLAPALLASMGCVSALRAPGLAAGSAPRTEKAYAFGFFAALTGKEGGGGKGISVLLERRDGSSKTWLPQAEIPFRRLTDSAYMSRATWEGTLTDREGARACLVVLELEPGEYRFAGGTLRLGLESKAVSLDSAHARSFLLEAGKLYYLESWIGGYYKTAVAASLGIREIADEIAYDSRLRTDAFPAFARRPIERVF